MYDMRISHFSLTHQNDIKIYRKEHNMVWVCPIECYVNPAQASLTIFSKNNSMHITDMLNRRTQSHTEQHSLNYDNDRCES